jgi:hypothetical protein
MAQGVEPQGYAHRNGSVRIVPAQVGSALASRSVRDGFPVVRGQSVHISPVRDKRAVMFSPDIDENAGFGNRAFYRQACVGENISDESRRVDFFEPNLGILMKVSTKNAEKSRKLLGRRHCNTCDIN